MELFLALTLVGAVVSAVFTAKLAELKGYDSSGWAVSGFLFGPLALIAAAGLPDARTRRYVRAFVEHQGIQVADIDTMDQKPQWTSNAYMGRTPEENYQIVSNLYKMEGGTGEPDFKSTSILARTITLKDAQGETLAYFSQRGDEIWHIVSISK